jgi:hypothetical protein
MRTPFTGPWPGAQECPAQVCRGGLWLGGASRRTVAGGLGANQQIVGAAAAAPSDLAYHADVKRSVEQ